MTTAERLTKLEATLDRYITELAEGDCKPSYNINGQAVNWEQYRTALNKWIKETQELIDMLGGDEGGIVEEVTQFTT
jgi:hypothetical protein